MSIPFAIGRRLDRGDSPWKVWRHILTRALGLLAIGVFMVNAENMPDQGLLPAPLWALLMYVGVFMVWSAPPRASGRPPQRSIALRGAGIVLLLLLAILYRGKGEPAFIELRPQWWGILGLIGWAYLVTCTVYLLARKNLPAVIGTIPLLYCVFIAHAAGAFAGWIWLTDWILIGSHPAPRSRPIATACVGAWSTAWPSRRPPIFCTRPTVSTTCSSSTRTWRRLHGAS
jgi:hypothetical protein